MFKGRDPVLLLLDRDDESPPKFVLMLLFVLLLLTVASLGSEAEIESFPPMLEAETEPPVMLL